MIDEIIAIIKSINEGIEGCKSIYKSIPQSIFFPPARKNLTSLEQKILDIQVQFDSLEEKINSDLPELSRLIRSYARISSEIRIAKILADKASEIYGLVPELSRYKSMFVNEREREFGRINSGVNDLPNLDVNEKGRLDEKLKIVRDYILELKIAEENDTQNLKKLFDRISTQYSDIEAIISELPEKILLSMSKTQQ